MKTTTRFPLAFLMTALATGASAHSKTNAYSPEDGATVTELPEITMSFADPMRIISVDMTHEGEDAALERETGTDPVTEFIAHPADAPVPGDYKVERRGMGADGHPMQGSFSFTLAD